MKTGGGNTKVDYHKQIVCQHSSMTKGVNNMQWITHVFGPEAHPSVGGMGLSYPSYSLVTLQNLIAVCHTVWAYVGPK